MREVEIRELNEPMAAVLACVQRGERVAITRNGRRIAILEPADPSPLGTMIESGEFRPAEVPLELPSAAEPISPGAAGLEAVLEDRDGNGRW